MGSYSLTKIGVSAYDWRDPYRLAITLSWPQFFAMMVSLYLAVNCFFALLFWLVPGCVANARPGVFSDHFFFSFETLATVGYGAMYPDTLYGHSVASAEIMTGIAFTAILTGLVFARFARPRAKFLVAKHAVVTTHNGKPTLMLRVGNGRASTLADARARLSVLLTQHSAENARFRRTLELKLERNHIPVFPLTWTLMHVIDETSPLFDVDPNSFEAADARVFLSLEARDPVLSTTVYDVRDFDRGMVRFAAHYVDMIHDDENGSPVADMGQIDAIEADATPLPKRATPWVADG